MKNDQKESEEKWMAINSINGYEVSSYGRVRSIGRVVTSKNGRSWFVHGKVLLLHKRPNGYVFFGTTGKTHQLSRVVLTAFVGDPICRSMHACHNNGIKSDNNVGNLRWGTPKENNSDKIKHCTHICGERHIMSKITINQVIQIRSDKRTHILIASQYGISRQHVSAIKSNKYWKSI